MSSSSFSTGLAGLSTGRRTGLVVGIVVAVLGFGVPTAVSSPNSMTILLDGIMLGLSALSVGFLLDLLDWVSFGGAAFSGVGAYLFAIYCGSLHMHTLAAAVLALVTGVVGAALIGLVFVRSNALVFTMLTLALGQLLLQMASLSKWTTVTGGADGLLITNIGGLFGVDENAQRDPGGFWPVVWGAAVVLVALVYLLRYSRLGSILRGIRENEMRMRHAGFNTFIPRLVAFSLAGLIGATAGILQAVNTGYVSSSLFAFSASGTAIIAALVGGYESPIGPILGGLVVTWGQNELGATGDLSLYTGIAVVVVLVFFRRGAIGILDWLWRSATQRPHRTDGRRPDQTNTTVREQADAVH